MKDYILLGEGRNRQVWRRGNYVVKVPLNEYGIGDNYHEADTYRRSLREKMPCKYARCRLVGPNSTLLVMEYTKYVGPLSDQDGYIVYENCPTWAYSLDCWQVGYNRAGEIVAYDYGLH